MEQRRLRILAIAYACDPERGSEFAVGWGWVRNIASRHDVLVVTADFNKPSIESYLAARRHDRDWANLRFAYVPSSRLQYKPQGLWLKIEASALKPLMNFAYTLWLSNAMTVAIEASQQAHFDLVHLVTYVGYRFPGKFWELGIPFVWGPIGGLENTPWRLLGQMGARGAFFFACRNLVNSIQLRVLPGPKRAFAAANGAVIAATSGIQTAICRYYGSPSTVICEVGPPEVPAGCPAVREPGSPLVICWSGTHLPGKALPLLLRALASVPSHVTWRLKVLGDGPSKGAWRSLSTKLGIDRHCCWSSWTSRSKSLEEMRESHVFVMTSLKDLTSNVCMEALSLGLPVVCLDHCGFADLVTPDCGIKIPIASSQQIQRDLNRAIEELWSDEPKRRMLSSGARLRCEAYSWERKIDLIDEIYASAIRQPVRTRNISDHVD